MGVLTAAFFWSLTLPSGLVVEIDGSTGCGLNSMKEFLKRCVWVLLGLLLSLCPHSSRADDGLELSWNHSPDPVAVSNLLSFTLNLTNNTGSTLTNLVITNTFTSTLAYSGLTANTGIVSRASGLAVLLVPFLTNSGDLEMTFTVIPSKVGQVTNSISLATTNASISVIPIGTTNTVPLTNIVITATVVAALGDLGVAVTSPTLPTLIDDYATLTLTVSNAGPSSVPNVVLSNYYPAGAIFRSVSVSNSTVQATLTNFVINLGTFASNQTTTLLLTLQPTNSGTFSVLASATASGNQDPNSANNLISGNFAVLSPLSGAVSVSFIQSAPVLDQQTGLMIQTVRLANPGVTVIDSARLYVNGLRLRHPTIPDRLMNAIGTNNGLPYILVRESIPAGGFVDAQLEFFFPTRQPDSSLIYTATGVPAVVFNTTVSGVGISISTNSIPDVLVGSGGDAVPGGVLIEFAATVGHRYTIVYSDSPTFSTAHPVYPAIVAAGDRVQWVDRGPPATESVPVNASSRFYRVFESP